MDDGISGYTLVSILKDVKNNLNRSIIQLIILPLLISETRKHFALTYGAPAAPTPTPGGTGPAVGGGGGPTVKRPLIIGVFGPYGDGGQQHLEVIGQKVSSLGCMAISGGFVYPPHDLNVRLLADVFSPEVNDFITILDREDFLYRDFLPTLIDGATVRLIPIRSNAYELEGCIDNRKPILGYVISSDLKEDLKNCHYVDTILNTPYIIQKCKATDKAQCLGNSSKPPKCPFAEIPWFMKLWFIETPSNILAAINQTDAIDPLLDLLIKVYKSPKK